MCVCVCVCACVRACVRAWVCARLPIHAHAMPATCCRECPPKCRRRAHRQHQLVLVLLVAPPAPMRYSSMTHDSNRRTSRAAGAAGARKTARHYTKTQQQRPPRQGPAPMWCSDIAYAASASCCLHSLFSAVRLSGGGGGGGKDRRLAPELPPPLSGHGSATWPRARAGARFSGRGLLLRAKRRRGR